MSYAKYQSCIDACVYCAAMCSQCADACLEEEGFAVLKKCVRLDLECAAICRSAIEVMMLDGKYVDAICQLCADICSACAGECEQHAKMGMEHCRLSPRPAGFVQKSACRYQSLLNPCCSDFTRCHRQERDKAVILPVLL